MAVSDERGASRAESPAAQRGGTFTMDGKTLHAAEGLSLLEAGRAAGIAIPTLCHHEAVEPWGACRLCLVEVSRADWPEPRMVVSCMYPTAAGLSVRTDAERVRAARAQVLDLLLARCPDTPLIRRMAREYGIQETSYRRSESPTDCVLCGLCTRVCDRLGFSAISMTSRGIGREVAPPFKQPPADCVGCLACAAICPTGHIRFETTDRQRAIWGKTFAMLRCSVCGRAHITAAQADAWSARSGVPRAYFEVCDACKRARVAETVGRLTMGG